MKKWGLLSLLIAAFVVNVIVMQLPAMAGAWCEGTLFSCNAENCLPPPPPPPCTTCPGTRSPNFVKTGNYFAGFTDLQISTAGLPLTAQRRYDNTKTIDGVFGIGWSGTASARLSYAVYLYAAPSTYYKEVTVSLPDGQQFEYMENADGVTYSSTIGLHDTIIRNGDESWDFSPANSRIIYHFSSTGALTSIDDGLGNLQSWTYDGSGRLQQTTDVRSGRYLAYSYGADGRVSIIQDSAGRQAHYYYATDGTLTSFVDPANRVTSYSYVNGRFVPLLSQIKDNWNRVLTTLTYYPSDRLKSYTENGETYTYTYTNATTTTKADSSGNTWTFTFDGSGRVTQEVPPAHSGGGTINSMYISDGSVQQLTDEVGVKTFYTYNANGTVASITRDYQGSLAVRFDYSYDSNFGSSLVLPVKTFRVHRSLVIF
jgi:YD repeat-containing protein